MSTPSFALRDSATMLRRQLRHMLRYPVTMFVVVVIPIVFLLLFVYVFGWLCAGRAWRTPWRVLLHQACAPPGASSLPSCRLWDYG